MKIITMLAVLTILSFSGFAQDTTKLHKQKTEKMKYSCPMHPDIRSKTQGKCSVCGMDLVKSKKMQVNTESKKVFACPMHPDVVSDKPGKCSKCGMELKEKQNMVYYCPMKCEGDKTYDKAGKCPVCGMNLRVKKDDHINHHD